MLRLKLIASAFVLSGFVYSYVTIKGLRAGEAVLIEQLGASLTREKELRDALSAAESESKKLRSNLVKQSDLFSRHLDELESAQTGAGNVEYEITEVLNETEHKPWADQLVPNDVKRLLNAPRDSSDYSH